MPGHRLQHRLKIVERVVSYLSMLVVTGVNKCGSQCLIVFPKLFERYFHERVGASLTIREQSSREAVLLHRLLRHQGLQV